MSQFVISFTISKLSHRITTGMTSQVSTRIRVGYMLIEENSWTSNTQVTTVEVVNIHAEVSNIKINVGIERKKTRNIRTQKKSQGGGETSNVMWISHIKPNTKWFMTTIRLSITDHIKRKPLPMNSTGFRILQLNCNNAGISFLNKHTDTDTRSNPPEGGVAEGKARLALLQHSRTYLISTL